jgi:uncharacterized protein involved in exopolysaccharide biosynthesis
VETNTERETHSQIDLIDVWLITRRHIWLFLILFVGISAFGTIYALMRSPRYNYSVTVQMGALQNNKTGAMDQMVSPEYVATTLNSVIIPAVVRDYASAHPGFNLHTVDIEVASPQASDVVVIGMDKPLAQAQLTTELLSAIANRLVKDEGAILQARLEATRQFLTKQISELQSKIDALNSTRGEMLAHGNRTDQLFTSLLIDNQISNLQERLLDLKSQLDVNLITSIRPMQILGAPQQSLQPAGLSFALKVFLSLVLGAIVGLIAVFVMHFYKMAQERSSQ